MRRQSSVCGSSAIGARVMQRRHSSRVQNHSFRCGRYARSIALSVPRRIPVRGQHAMSFSLRPDVANLARRCRFLVCVLLFSCTGDVIRWTGTCTRRRQGRCDPAAITRRRALPQTARIFADRELRGREK
jgi:hypothetical protein